MTTLLYKLSYPKNKYIYYPLNMEKCLLYNKHVPYV